MRFAINFLRSNVGIDSPALLSSPFLIIVLAWFGHHRGYDLTGADAAQLKRWALLASAKGRFSRGSTETILDQDLCADAIVAQVRLEAEAFVRLHGVGAEDLEGRDQRSSLFKTMFLAFRAAGAQDWTSNLSIARTHAGTQHKLEFHHFFPKGVLTRAGHTARDADEIANLTFTGGRTNRQIADKAPSAYAPAIVEKHGDAAFSSQAIPLDPSLWDVARYRDFLKARREMLAEVINAFLADATGPQPGTSIEALIAEREHDRLEFKASLRWDVKLSGINKVLEQVVLKSIAALANAQGGTLLIGVEDDGGIAGLAPDYATLEGDRDAFERHLRALIQARWGAAIGVGAVAISFPSLQDREICRVDVRRSAVPMFVEVGDKHGARTEKLFVRSGNASSPIDGISEAAAYINRRFPGYRPAG